MSERDDNIEQAFHTPEPPAKAKPVFNSDGIPVGQAGAGEGFNFLLDLQKEVEDLWGRRVDPTDPEAVSAYIRDIVLCTTDELHEVLAEVYWKPWKDHRGIKDVSKYREEMADVLHFILDLYLAAGLTGQDIVSDYVSKHRENVARHDSAAYRAS